MQLQKPDNKLPITVAPEGKPKPTAQVEELEKVRKGA